MIDKKAVGEIYKSIKAPDSLRKRVMSIEVPEGKTVLFFTRYRSATAVAASLILIIAAVLMVAGNYYSVGLSVNGQAIGTSPAAIAADINAKAVQPTLTTNTELSVPLDINVKAQATVSIEEGYLSINGKNSVVLTADSGNAVTWLLPEYNRDSVYSLRISTAYKKQSYQLYFDNGQNNWVIKASKKTKNNSKKENN